VLRVLRRVAHRHPPVLRRLRVQVLHRQRPRLVPQARVYLHLLAVRRQRRRRVLQARAYPVRRLRVQVLRPPVVRPVVLADRPRQACRRLRVRPQVLLRLRRFQVRRQHRFRLAQAVARHPLLRLRRQVLQAGVHRLAHRGRRQRRHRLARVRVLLVPLVRVRVRLHRQACHRRLAQVRPVLRQHQHQVHPVQALRLAQVLHRLGRRHPVRARLYPHRQVVRRRVVRRVHRQALLLVLQAQVYLVRRPHRRLTTPRLMTVARISLTHSFRRSQIRTAGTSILSVLSPLPTLYERTIQL